MKKIILWLFLYAPSIYAMQKTDIAGEKYSVYGDRANFKITQYGNTYDNQEALDCLKSLPQNIQDVNINFKDLEIKNAQFVLSCLNKLPNLKNITLIFKGFNQYNGINPMQYTLTEIEKLNNIQNINLSTKFKMDVTEVQDVIKIPENTNDVTIRLKQRRNIHHYDYLHDAITTKIPKIIKNLTYQLKSITIDLGSISIPVFLFDKLNPICQSIRFRDNLNKLSFKVWHFDGHQDEFLEKFTNTVANNMPKNITELLLDFNYIHFGNKGFDHILQLIKRLDNIEKLSINMPFAETNDDLAIQLAHTIKNNLPNISHLHLKLVDLLNNYRGRANQITNIGHKELFNAIGSKTKLTSIELDTMVNQNNMQANDELALNFIKSITKLNLLNLSTSLGGYKSNDITFSKTIYNGNHKELAKTMYQVIKTKKHTIQTIIALKKILSKFKFKRHLDITKSIIDKFYH